MAAQNVIHLRIKRFLSFTETLWKVETFRSGLCMQHSFIVVRTYLVHVFASGSDICHLFQMSASGSVTVDAQVWTHLNYLEVGGFPALLWDTLKDFGYPTYPEYSARELMSTGQLLRWEVKVKIPGCPTHPTWEEWEVKAQGLNLADTVQKAALEALTTFCEKHAELVASTTAKVFPLPKQHSGHGIECEAFLSAQSNHHSPELDTSVRFSKAMFDTYQVMVGESMFYRHQVYRQQVNSAEAITREVKEARATIARLKKRRRKDRTIIQELSEVIHEQKFLLRHNDQYMLDLENQLESVAAPPHEPEE
jgi:hypothetical protein